MNNKNIIDEYILNFSKIEGEVKKEYLDNIKKYLEDLDLNKLMDLVYKYSDMITDNLEDLFVILKDAIIEKFKTISLIKIIDLYIELFNKTMLVSDTLMASKNILAVMSYNISDDLYIEKEIAKKKITKEEYLTSLKKDLDNNVSIIENYNKSHEYLEDLQNKFLIYIEMKLETIENQEKSFLIQNLNKRFGDASLKLIKLKDSFEKVKELDKSELLNVIEYNNLKNHIVVYDSFRNTLLNEKKNDN